MSSSRSSTAWLSLGALGVVYGDIGTSPLYTVKEIFNPAIGIALSQGNIIGAISSIFWLLMLVVTLKYVILVLRADNRGEGGILALLSLAVSSIRQSRTKTVLLGLGVFGAALFYGDSILTPAISVLSAVEGLEVATPQFKDYVLPISMAIMAALFLVQRYGTGAVGKLFGPLIVIWFATLGIAGYLHIARHPEILQALNPVYAVHFLADRGSGIFLTIGAVVLAVTGAEALYADMGHFGRPAIRYAWTFVVLPGLALNYLGQGALLLGNPEAIANPFYLIFPENLLVPAVILATTATIIASQAVISGAYSMTQQAIHLGFLPRMRVLHTSADESGQIYLPTINWILLGGVLTVMAAFGSSSALASAYGIAVTGTMLITTILIFFVLRYYWKLPLLLALLPTAAFMVMDAVLFGSCSIKFMSGGWLPFALGIALFGLMWIWRNGRLELAEHLRKEDPSFAAFLNNLSTEHLKHVDRTAVFMVANSDTVPQALLHNLKHNQVLHRDNLLVTIVFREVPALSTEDRIEWQQLEHGFWKIRIHYGFMEQPDVPATLAQANIPGLAINPYTMSYFVSREVIVPTAGKRMKTWRDHLFSAMSRNAGSVVGYFRLPSNSVIELGSRIQI